MKLSVVMALLLPLLFTGCASMNKKECVNADWQVIGIEDGSRGKALANLGRHRSACSEHDVKPDLAAYKRGHREGLRRYCTEIKGFELGKDGSKYNGVCPAELEQTFLDGYYMGKQLYGLKVVISGHESDIKSAKAKLKNLNKLIKQKEQQLISDKTSKAMRITLIDEIKVLERRRGNLQAKILEYEKEVAVREDELERLARMLPY